MTREWENLIQVFKDEVNILIDAPLGDVKEVAQKDVGRAIEYFREGKVVLYPGGGGDYGKAVVPKPGQVLEPPRPKVAGNAKKSQVKLTDFE